jgi:hypothetical protein
MKQAKFIRLLCILIMETLNGGQEDIVFNAYSHHVFQCHKYGKRERLYCRNRRLALVKKVHNVNLTFF